MRRNSIVLAFLKMVFLSAVVVKAGQLRSRQFVTKNNSQNDEKTPNHETNVENKEPEEHQNGRIGRKLERKKIRIHKVSATFWFDEY